MYIGSVVNDLNLHFLIRSGHLEGQKCFSTENYIFINIHFTAHLSFVGHICIYRFNHLMRPKIGPMGRHSPYRP